MMVAIRHYLCSYTMHNITHIGALFDDFVKY